MGRLLLLLLLLPGVALAKPAKSAKKGAPKAGENPLARNEPGAPPLLPAQRALFRQPGAFHHLSVYAVDEGCFDDATMKSATWPSGLGISKMEIGDEAFVALTIDGPSPAPFAELKRFAQQITKPGRKMVYGRNMLGDEYYGYKVECVVTPALLGDGEVAHVVNKLDPSIDQKAYRVGLTPPSLEKLRKMPKGVLRLAFVYDEDVLVNNLNTEGLREQTETAVFDLIELK